MQAAPVTFDATRVKGRLFLDRLNATGEHRLGNRARFSARS